MSNPALAENLLSACEDLVLQRDLQCRPGTQVVTLITAVDE